MRTLSQMETGCSTGARRPAAAHERFLGIDIGTETVKLVELACQPGGLRIGRREVFEHEKNPGPRLLDALRRWDWSSFSGAAVTGRFSNQVQLPRIPTKQAQLRGYRFHFGTKPATVVSIGSHGFSVLEIRDSAPSVFRENSRCSQGTGNFLRQLVERFSLDVQEASALCCNVPDPAPLSGRCPVILKTDMTHLANKGEDRARILAGLFDAVCENVLVLIKPGVSPRWVLLTGGVSRSARVRRVLGEALARQQMELIPFSEPHALDLEALGCAVIASEQSATLPPLESLLAPAPPLNLERLPPLIEALGKVQRMPARPWAEIDGEARRSVLGFDIGSTGAKLVAIDIANLETLWEGYRQTLGDPVGAAQDLLRRFVAGPAGKCPLIGFGVTGSGRDIAGSLLTSCYGKEAVFIVNEIVAHATGALHYDQRVDTVFEIGGQDAKYIRLAEGRIIDCAMNEACSAGTGSFIEEQGRKFPGIQDVTQLGRAAMSAPWGISLGQHCSVFMAEVIDESVGAGVEPQAIISGLYDSIIKNYLNRVKGNRSVGKVIFCQGMPFSADALAAAVARQTGSEVIVPPNPGTVGALGIAVLATRELAGLSGCQQPVAAGVSHSAGRHPFFDPNLFLHASVEEKDSFVCRASSGCGGVGNRCRIERLRTVVNEHRANFTWGGGCALHDKATRKKKLPDLAPDPFREQSELAQKLVVPFLGARGKPRIALADEFMLKGLFPFFAAFFHHSGYDLELVSGSNQATLKRGIQFANVPFCAPMQLFHGLAERMAETGAERLFVPMVRSLEPAHDQRRLVVCPIVQASPDVMRCSLNGSHGPADRLLCPLIDFGPGGFESEEFLASCRRLGKTLGVSQRVWRSAWAAGVKLQREFEQGSGEIGQRALDFCRQREVVPVVVLGRSYTIHNKLLNSNVPAILREQGAIGIPVDCYPLEQEGPQFDDMYWAYGQSLLRAAHQVRRTPGQYALYCSNYSCGPDSFNLHFAAYVMEGKPFAIIETDGHSGDAGTKTRVEAFLHCVDEDRRAPHAAQKPTDFASIQSTGLRLRDVGRYNGETETMLIPCLGATSDAVAAVFRGVGLNAEALPPPDMEAMRRGRRFTSGKECLPMPLTLGSLLQRLEKARPGERFVYVMPSTDGPCRFGVYNLLNRIVLERLGWSDRLRIWAPKDSGYFDDLPAGAEMLMVAGIVATDVLFQALLDVRPLEHEPGHADALYRRFSSELFDLLERAGRGDLRLSPALWQVAGGRLFGIRDLLARAAKEFAAARGSGSLPRVELTGEIYVRAVEFSNDFLIQKLESRGLRVRLAPQSEWVAYCGYVARRRSGRNLVADHFAEYIQKRIETLVRAAMAPHLGWPRPPSIEQTLAAAQPYLNPELEGEAVLTVGGALEAFHRRQVDGVISVGPLECMPTKIAEAQFHYLAEREGLLNLTLAFNGDTVSGAALDNFAFEVKTRFAQRSDELKETRIAPIVTNGALVEETPHSR